MFEKPCHGCPFTSSSCVSPSRTKGIVDDLKKRDLHFTCHKNRKGEIEAGSGEVMCRGYYDKIFKRFDYGAMTRLLESIGAFVVIPMPKDMDEEARRTLGTWKQITTKEQSDMETRVKRKRVSIMKVVGGVRHLACGHTAPVPRGGKAHLAHFAYCPTCDGKVDAPPPAEVVAAETTPPPADSAEAAKKWDAVVLARHGENHTYSCWQRLAWGDGKCQCGGEKRAKEVSP